jgi:hypothetical protein
MTRMVDEFSGSERRWLPRITVFTGIKNAGGIKSPAGHKNVVDPHRERRLSQERLRVGLKIFAGLTNISGPP